MAEGLAKKFAIENGWENIHILSRALTEDYEPSGSPASDNGVEIMKSEYNIDISGHRSAMLTQKDVDEATFIVGVSQSHCRYILQNYDRAREKCVSLQTDIPDPWHQGITVFSRCAKTINECIPKIFESHLNHGSRK